MFSPYDAYGSPFYTRPAPQPSYRYSNLHSHPLQQQGWGQPARGYNYYDDDEDDRLARARALAEARARRAQWLPDEEYDPADDWEYSQLGPRERMYLEAQRRRQLLERQQREQEAAQRREAERRRAEEQRWHEQLERRQREEDARRRAIVEEQRRLQQQRREEARLREEAERQNRKPISRPSSAAPNGRPRRASGPTEIPIQSDSPAPSSRPQTPPLKSPTPQPQYDERHEQAATVLQNHFRIHKSFTTIHGLEKEFDDAKARFTFPSSIDFQNPAGEGTITVPAAPPADDAPALMDVDQPDGKLAYSSANYGVHAYAETLLRLLTKLDGVESWGDRRVRMARRAVVKRIEEESARVERWWKSSWREHVAAGEAKTGSEEEDRADPEKAEGQDDADDAKMVLEDAAADAASSQGEDVPIIFGP